MSAESLLRELSDYTRVLSYLRGQAQPLSTPAELLALRIALVERIRASLRALSEVVL